MPQADWKMVMGGGRNLTHAPAWERGALLRLFMGIQRRAMLRAPAHGPSRATGHFHIQRPVGRASPRAVPFVGRQEGWDGIRSSAVFISSGRSMLAVGCWMLDVGCWLFDIQRLQ